MVRRAVHVGRLRRARRPTLGALGDVAGLDVVELGCGTAYFSAWLARQGARPVGVDVTPAQLDTARRMQEETGIEFPLVEASAEDVPLARRELRPRGLRVRSEPLVRPGALDPGGRAAPAPGRPTRLPDEQHARDPLRPVGARATATEQLQRPQRGMLRRSPGTSRTASSSTSATATGSTSCTRAGFEVERLVELYAPDDAETHPYYDTATAEWARQVAE